MFSSSLSVIIVDKDAKAVRFYPSGENCGDSVFSPFHSNIGEDSFFTEFKEILSRRSSSVSKAVLVLPDSLFVTDTLDIPVMSKRAVNAALSTAIGSLYKNAGEIEFITHQLYRKNRITMFGLSGLRREISSKIRACCEAVGISVKAITFAANAAVLGAFFIAPSLKKEDFLLIDIKPAVTRLAFVANGITCAYFSLPYGSDTLCAADAKDDGDTDELRLLHRHIHHLLHSDTITVTAAYVNVPTDSKFLISELGRDSKVPFFTLSDDTVDAPLELLGAKYVRRVGKKNVF